MGVGPWSTVAATVPKGGPRPAPTHSRRFVPTELRCVMATETWTRIAVPLLEHFANHEVEYAARNDAIELGPIAEALDLDVDAAEVELHRLFTNGYLDGGYHPEYPAGTSWMIRPALTAKGARAARVWPPDDAADAFLAIIERRLQEAPPEQRGFWQKIKEGFAGVPGSVTGSLAVEAVKALAS